MGDTPSKTSLFPAPRGDWRESSSSSSSSFSMEHPEVKGVVFITLPPADDPSQGKTITAIAFSNNPPPQAHPQAHHDRQSPSSSAAPLSFLPSRKALALVVGLTLLASSLFVCLLSEAPLQFLEEKAEGRKRRDDDSFWLPLYPKFKGPAGGNRTALMSMGNLKMRVQSVKSAAAVAIDSSAAFPLRGNVFPDGQYYTSIFIGNPPRPYFLDVDTGSDLTWIQCDAPCTSCAKGPHPLYKPTKEKIVPPWDSFCLEVQRNLNNKYCDSCQQCDYEVEYADHSSSMGVLARDEMHLVIANGDRAKVTFVFGCAYDQQGLLLASPAKTDGILGLGNAKVSLPSQLADQGVTNNFVGHCITSEARGGGYMFFGDDFVPRWGMTWIPAISSSTNFYQSEVLKLSYGDQQISTGRDGDNVGQVVFDTGSSYTYFPSEAYTHLMTILGSMSSNLVRDHSDQTLPLCWRAGYHLRSVKDVEQFFQPFTLQFGNRWLIMSTKFTIPPEGYLVISNKGNVCLGVLNGSEVHDGSAIILGDISLRGKLVVYDNIQHKIGWTSSNCIKPQRRPKDFPFFF